MDVKKHLHALIKNSATFKSLPEAERKARTDMMLSADEATMQKFIAILEKEVKGMEKVEADFQKSATEIEGLVAEAQALEKEANRIIRKEEEATERAGEEKAADELLKQLDDITN